MPASQAVLSLQPPILCFLVAEPRADIAWKLAAEGEIARRKHSCTEADFTEGRSQMVRLIEDERNAQAQRQAQTNSFDRIMRALAIGAAAAVVTSPPPNYNSTTICNWSPDGRTIVCR